MRIEAFASHCCWMNAYWYAWYINRYSKVLAIVTYLWFPGGFILFPVCMPLHKPFFIQECTFVPSLYYSKSGSSIPSSIKFSGSSLYPSPISQPYFEYELWWYLSIFGYSSYTVGKSRFTIVSMWNTEFIFVSLFINYCSNFHMNDCIPPTAPPCMLGSNCWFSSLLFEVVSSLGVG